MKAQHPAPVYAPHPMWARVPHGITFGAGANDVAVSPDDEIHVFNRGSDPVVVFDRSGTYLRSWGHGEFVDPHGITFGPTGEIYLVDSGGHFVEKRSSTGRLLLSLGSRAVAAPAQSGIPFNRPTAVAVADDGTMFITDGYGNSRVHRFSPDGDYLGGWGEPGSEPGRFDLPHGICWISNDRLAVCDRENNRVQVFDRDGTFVEAWPFHRPSAIARGQGPDAYLYVAELPAAELDGWRPEAGRRVSVIEPDGRRVAVLGETRDDRRSPAPDADPATSPTPGSAPDQFIAPHGIAVDSHGDVYVAELSALYLSRQAPPVTPLGEIVSLRKWDRVA